LPAPDRIELLSATMLRALARIRAQVRSIVGSDLYPVWETTIPRSAAATTSIEAFTGPVEAMITHPDASARRIVGAI